MRGSRGRILQALGQMSISRESEQDQEDPSGSQQETPAAPVRTPKGRGGLLISRLSNVRTQPPAQEPTTESTSGDRIRPGTGSNSSNSSAGSPRLNRQDSDAGSNSSLLSQQFAAIEQVNYKANLPKDPSTQGNPVRLSLNYMTFEVLKDTSIEEYHVEFIPNIESIRLRYSVLRTEQAQEIIGNVMHWTGTNLYLPIKLAQKETSFVTTHPVTNNEISVKLVYIKTPPDSELVSFYNSLMHKVMNRLHYVIINRQHYSPLHKIAIEQFRLEVWPGWITAVQRLDGGLKLSIDASFRVLRLETVRDIMIIIKDRDRGSSLKEAIEQELVGTIIMTKYNNKAYRIDGIDLQKKPTDTFISHKNSEPISFVEYMRQHWNTQVRDLNQPMIVHRPKPKRGQEATVEEVVYLIPELCVTTGLTDEMRSNHSLMRALAVNTKLPPAIRENKLKEFLQQVSTDERSKSVFADWNLAVRPELDIVDGRRLENETVLFGGNRSFKVPDNADWTRPATSGAMFKTVDIQDWVIMYTDRDREIAKEFLQSVKECSQQLGIKFNAPRIVVLPNDTPTTYVNFGKREVRNTDQMVVLLTPGKGQREDRYSACKRLYSCELPVPCQFIRCGTISNRAKLRTITQKVCIQILSKVGGQPWAMTFPLKSFMIVGVDVYHDTIDRKKSCVGFVASMNATTSAWYSITFFQNSLEEISNKLGLSLISAIKKFHQNNGFTPQKIIFYRDGVGDGQLDTVLQVEVAQLINSMRYYMRDNHAEDPVPHLSYIIVQKRINAKIALRQASQVINPLPGSFLDHTITHPEYNDFYLVSQHVNLGTVSPTKYIVLAETGTLKVSHHQKLAYKMTHMYYNWCGTVRVPAPCQYAHKLAYLTGQNIRQQASGSLENKLYYL